MTFSCKHDLHCHTRLSACCHDERMTTQRIALHAAANGYDAACITDHLWSRQVPGAMDWYASQDVAHVEQSLPLPVQEGLSMYFGCETEYLGKDKLGLTLADMDRFDFIVVPINHFHMIGFVRPADITDVRGIARLATQRLEELVALALPFEKIGIAHLSCDLMYKEGNIADVLMEMDADAVSRAFEKFAKAGGGIELNASAFKGLHQAREAYLRIYRLAKDAGCRFYCASDAHSFEALSAVGMVLPEVVEALQLTEAQRYLIPERYKR